MGNAPGPGAVSKRLEQRRSAGEAAQRELESDDEFFEPLEDVAAPPDATLDELSGDFREMLSVLRSSAAPEDALAGALETVRLTDDAEELDGTTHAIARSAATAREAQSAPSALFEFGQAAVLTTVPPTRHWRSAAPACLRRRLSQPASGAPSGAASVSLPWRSGTTYGVTLRRPSGTFGTRASSRGLPISEGSAWSL